MYCLIHIGHVYGHYFLIKDKTLLHTLSASDFQRFEDKNEELALKIDTLRDPKYFVMRKVGNTILWEDEDLPITDLEIQKRIKSYQKQDEKANREVDTTLSVTDVRELLSSKTCSHCSKPIMWSNWTLDRINNSKSHSKNNLVLACYHCNVKKKDKEQEIYTWDTEAHPYLKGVFHELCNWVSEEIANMIMNYIPDSRTHVIYSAGITKFDIEILRKADAGLNGETFDGHLYTYNDLHTEIFYGESGLDGTNPEGAFFKLENWLINKSEEIRRKVDRELNSFLDWYIRNVLDKKEYIEENYTNLRDNIETLQMRSGNLTSVRMTRMTMMKRLMIRRMDGQIEKDEREDRLKKATNSRKRKELTNRYKAIFYGFFSAPYDNQYIFKSKRLRFQSIIDNHGIIQLLS